jgi:sugar phosphate permease
MAVCLLLTALASFLLSTSASFLDIKLYRSLLGLFEAPVTICCVTIINHWFATREKGTAAGLLFASSKLGPVICPPLAVVILHLFGWREIFRIFAVPVALLAVVWFVFVRNQPRSPISVPLRREGLPSQDAARNSAGVAGAHPAGQAHSLLDRLMRRKSVNRIETSGAVFRSWNIIGIALAYLCMVGILNVMLAWLPSYLLNAKHLSVTDMGFLSAAPFAGAVSGNVAGGWISDRLLHSRRKPLMMIGALLTAAMFVVVLHAPDNIWLIGVMLLVLGTLFGLGYPAFSVYPMGITTKEVYPLAFSVVNTAASLGAAVFPLAAGFILDRSGWETVFYFLALSSLACLALLATVDEPVPD